MNGHGLGGQQPHSEHLARFSPLRDERDFVPLNIDGPSSAPVPASARPGSPARANSVQGKLGRASSSKKWLLIAAAATAATIALAVGLGVGLSKSSSSSSSESSGSDSSGSASGGEQPAQSTGTPAQLYSMGVAAGTGLPDACKALAQGTAPGSNYWDLLEAQEYRLTLDLRSTMFTYNNRTWEGRLESFQSFTAQSAVQFEVSASAPQPVSCVLLNSVGLTINSVSVGAVEVCGDKSGQPCSQYVWYDLKRQADGAEEPASTADINLMAISLGNQTLSPGEPQWVSLTYTGKLGAWPTSNEGLLQSAPFVSTADEPLAGLDLNDLQALIVTQGAKLGTRRYLPCYDSPARKAKFSVTAKVPEGATVLSNARELTTTTVDGQKVVEFEPTPVMSPYLLALVAGNLRQYGGAGAGVVGGVQYGFYAAPGLEWQLEMAAQIAPKAFQFFKEYVGIIPANSTQGQRLEQPIQKFDFVAVPGKTGAMENWGLLLFDERRLLYNEAWEGAYGLQQAVNVICHEVAHQWFGNLATKADWTQVSVDEGLASYLEYPCMEAVSSEFANTSNVLFARFVSPQLELPGPHDAPTHTALYYGADPGQPAIVPANDLEIGTGTFIHYAKPASILRSYELYLKENSGGNKDNLRLLLSTWLAASALGTWEWKGLFATLQGILEESYTQANDTMKPAVQSQIRTLETRARSFWEADNYEEVMDVIDSYYFTPQASGQYSVATWFYLPLYPLVAPSVSLINTTSYNETLFNFGMTAKPFCSYRISEGLADSLGISNEAADVNELCDYPAGRRLQPLTLALDNLTDCGTGNSNAAGGWSGKNWAPLATQDPPSFTDNQHGARNFRSLYDDEQLETMIDIAASMRNICGRNNGGDTEGGTCCARQTDVLEAAGLISDATELAKVGRMEGGSSPFEPGGGMAPPLSRNNLTATRVLDMTERVIMEGGDPNEGEWQFIMGSAASESLFQWKRVTDWLGDTNCTVASIVYINTVLTRLGNQTAAEWLTPDTTPPTDVLKRIAGPRLLWQLGMIDDSRYSKSGLAPKMCQAFTKTNLWQRWVVAGEVNGEMQRNTGALPGPTHEPTLGDQQPAPPNSDSVPIDLVPALYMVGAALPRDCDNILLDSAGRNATPTIADLLPKLVTGLQNCVLFDEDPAEAQRCLFAMPSLALATGNAPLVASAVQSTMGWLLAAGGWPDRTWPKQELASFYRRKMLITDQLPAILTNIGRSNPVLHAAVLDYLAKSDLGSAMLCGILDTMSAPAGQAPYDKLIALLTTGKGKNCPPMLRLRVAGKAERAKKLAEEQAEDICEYVQAALAEWMRMAG